MARRLLPSPTAPEARLPIARAINISPSMSAHEPRPRPSTTRAGRSRSCHPGCSTGPTPASRPLPRHHTRWPGTDHARGGAGSAGDRSTCHAEQSRGTEPRIRRAVGCSASLRASSATFCQTPADEQEPRSRGSGAVLPPQKALNPVPGRPDSDPGARASDSSSAITERPVPCSALHEDPGREAIRRAPTRRRGSRACGRPLVPRQLEDRASSSRWLQLGALPRRGDPKFGTT
jgi:hypothetical protein